jgi:hypothetical protein
MEKGKRRGIPTVYKGFKMRSRLEALWARVFDSLGWEWIYEPDIELPESIRKGWIPDFLLPQIGIFVEVKPNITGTVEQLAEHGEVLRAARCCESLDMPLLVLGLSPAHYWDDAGGVKIGIILHSSLSVTGNGYVLLRPGTKRWVSLILAGDWECNGKHEFECSFWRDHEIFEEPHFSHIWTHCCNENQYQPRLPG